MLHEHNIWTHPKATIIYERIDRKRLTNRALVLLQGRVLNVAFQFVITVVCNLLLSAAHQHVLQWRPAAVWSRVSGRSAGRRAPGGSAGSILHCLLPGPHSSAGVRRLHPLLPDHGATSDSTPVTPTHSLSTGFGLCWQTTGYILLQAHKVEELNNDTQTTVGARFAV